MVEQFIGQYNLHVFNTGTTRTFQSGVGSSIKDITLCSAELLVFVQDWRLASSFCFSDHRRITFSLMNCILLLNRPFNLNKSDWFIFLFKLESKSGGLRVNYRTKNNVDYHVNMLTKDIRAAFRAACPIGAKS